MEPDEKGTQNDEGGEGEPLQSDTVESSGEDVQPASEQSESN